MTERGADFFFISLEQVKVAERLVSILVKATNHGNNMTDVNSCNIEVPTKLMLWNC